MVDAEVILWASPSSLDQLGWAPDELVGRRWDSMIYGPEKAAMRLPDEPGRRRVRRTRFVHRDGTVHWAELVLADLVDPDGNDEGTVVSARNVDAEASAQAAEHEASRQRDRLIEQLPLGVFRAGTDGDGVWRLDFMSPQCAELLRCPPGTNDVATVMSLSGAERRTASVRGGQSLHTGSGRTDV